MIQQRIALVTGGAGFIGSHLTEALLERGYIVRVVDNESTGNRGNLAHLADKPALEYTRGDVGDDQLIRSLLPGVDEVYHLAAAVGVGLIAKAPIRTIETNIYPTQLLLAAVYDHHLKGEAIRLYLASSSEVYGKNPTERWAEEDDLVFGSTTRSRWSYGVSKAIDEFLALAYWRQHGLPVVVGRFFNVVGPRQVGQYGMVLPRFIQAALAGESPIVHDDGQQVRCFAHVYDVVRTVLDLVSKNEAQGGVFNIGSDEPISILNLARRVVSKIDPDLKINFQSYSQAYSDDFEDVRSRIPDLTRLRSTIKLTPKYKLDSTIEDVIAWHRR